MPKSNIATRFSKGSSSFLQGFARQRKRQLIVSKDIQRPLIGSARKGVSKGYGRRGRPRGSFDSRYAAYGGVYGYRKQLNASLRIQKLQALRNSAINPQQQAILAQIEARQRQQQQAPENQIIPDTSGNVRLRSIHDEITDAANIIP